MKLSSIKPISLILIFPAIIVALINPACGESAGPGRGDDIPWNIAIFDQFQSGPKHTI